MIHLRSLLSALAVTWASSLIPNVVCAHDLKDGVVERDVQVVVFPDRVEIQYTVEMNPRTRDEHLEQMAANGKIQSKESLGNHATRLGPGVTSVRLAWDGYREILGDLLVEGFSLNIDSKQQTVELVSSETIEKHSIKLYFVFSAKFQVMTVDQPLALRDQNFKDHAGYHRMAIKGRRGVEVLDANVPIIVSRVKRVDWSKLTEQQQQNASIVRARISMAGS